jgi:trans-2,3-dihydro-3-hydroxyanthranilate isomerase
MDSDPRTERTFIKLAIEENMSHLNFYIVDVFAEQKYTGNQLAVVTGTLDLTGEQMQQIAKEMNYSETTFILSPEQRDGGYDVRIFTPAQEVPFAGHPTLGTAFIIQREIIKQPIEKIQLNLKIGQIPVTLSYEQDQVNLLWMEQKTPTFHRVIEPEAVASVISLEMEDLDRRFPIQEVSTGIPFLIVPLKTHAALKKAKVNRDQYFKLIEETEAKCIFLFCPETNQPENDLSARMFGDYLGVPEDPATGSANGCLAGYLVEYRYFGSQEIDLRVEQGYEMGRPSLLLLKAHKQNGKISVSVGGKAIAVARGEFV